MSQLTVSGPLMLCTLIIQAIPLIQTARCEQGTRLFELARVYYTVSAIRNLIWLDMMPGQMARQMDKWTDRATEGHVHSNFQSSQFCANIMTSLQNWSRCCSSPVATRLAALKRQLPSLYTARGTQSCGALSGYSFMSTSSTE